MSPEPHFLGMGNAWHVNSCPLHLYTTIPGDSKKTDPCTHDSDNFAVPLSSQQLVEVFPVVLRKVEAQAKREVLDCPLQETQSDPFGLKLEFFACCHWHLGAYLAHTA